MKERENGRCAGDRDLAQSQLEEFFGMIHHNDDNPNTQKAFWLMKKASRVSENIIVTAIELFLENNFEVFGAPYESDFQLAYWELTKFIDGTYTIDSEILFMGSTLTIDLLQFNSAHGKCEISVEEGVMPICVMA